MITRWMTRWPRSFLLTTNIDELHLQAGVPDDRVRQRYGSLWELQCLKPCRQGAWRDRRVPLVTLDEATMVASGFPTCPSCGGGARPRTQMAHDEQLIDDVAGSARHESFLIGGEPEVVVVVGTSLWFSWPEHVDPKPRVISINPDAERHTTYGDDVIALTAPASDALIAIDGAVRLLAGPWGESAQSAGPGETRIERPRSPAISASRGACAQRLPWPLAPPPAPYDRRR